METRGLRSPLPILGISVCIVHFVCFYWWASSDYYFSGDGLYYFSRRIETFGEFIQRLFSVDEMYQYRPLTYVFFSFVLFPLFGQSPAPYHAAAYIVSAINAVLASLCVYHWVGKKTPLAFFAIAVLLINPVHFFPSFGPTYIDQWLSSFFYFLALLFLLKDSPYAKWAASVSFLLALLSKEHSVMLPAHAALLLWAMGAPIRQALRRTRYLWGVLAMFMIFQLSIRGGSLFAPPGQNENLRYGFSTSRIADLALGAKAAVFYPENYFLDSVWPATEYVRLGSAGLLLALIIVALRRHPRLALSGLAWMALALAPVIFIRMPPFPRHYYLGLPGLAIVFAAGIGTWRAMAVAMPLFILATVSNVDLYSETSWIAVGARYTRSYLAGIQSFIDQTGRSEFYVTPSGDPNFYFNIDGGDAVPDMLGRQTSFTFGSLEGLPTDRWLNNSVNIITPEESHIRDAFDSGEFPPSANEELCVVVRELIGTAEKCSLIFRGRPLVHSANDVVETPGGLPIFRVPEGIATLSRLTLRIPVRDGLQLNRAVRVVPESADGVRIEIFQERSRRFEKVFERHLAPGERTNLQYVVPPGRADHLIVRVHAAGNEYGDWLIWEKTAPAG